MNRAHAFAALAARAPLVNYFYELDPLAPDDVEIEVVCCGLCRSDLHLIDDAWHKSVYPLVPGHEIAGRVVAVGDKVTHLMPGTLVGVGWQRSACLACDTCRRGRENLCARQVATCIGHHGGLSDRLRTDSRFVFAIPDGLEAAEAAPLMCGGVTVFAPLERWRAGPGTTVGVVGIGGLGHLAIRFAAARGCEVVALSSSPDKDRDARALGAHDVVRSTDARAVQSLAGRLDLILSTAPVPLDWPLYVGALREGGALCLVGAAPGLVRLPAAQLIVGEKIVCGSDIGSRASIQAMLGFAARHKITPVVETAPMHEVNLALEHVRNNRARYRVVMTS